MFILISTETARSINRTLAERDGPIIPFVAETGGQNAMIVDSSALPEQVTRDVVASSFQSAGQRCSAARILFVHSNTAGSSLNSLFWLLVFVLSGLLAKMPG